MQYVCSVARLTLCRHHRIVDGQATWGNIDRAAARREEEVEFEISLAFEQTGLS
jgi:hypothetical protein